MIFSIIKPITFKLNLIKLKIQLILKEIISTTEYKQFIFNPSDEIFKLPPQLIGKTMRARFN